MPQQGLNIHQVGPGVQQIRGVGMAQLVRGDGLGDVGLGLEPAQVSAAACEDAGGGFIFQKYPL